MLQHGNSDEQLRGGTPQDQGDQVVEGWAIEEILASNRRIQGSKRGLSSLRSLLPQLPALSFSWPSAAP
jgi:hypothetical protein